MEAATQWSHRRNENGPIKAVAITGFGTDQDVRRCKAAGFDFHLVKPIDFHELEQVLDQVGA
jgi:CheY-like chemotaxis protein